MCNFYLFLPLKELLNRNIKIYFLNNSWYRKWTNFYSFMDIVNQLFLQLGPFLTLGFFWEREARNVLTNTPPISGDILLLWNYCSIFICTQSPYTLLLILQLPTWVWKSRGQFARKHTRMCVFVIENSSAANLRCPKREISYCFAEYVCKIWLVAWLPNYKHFLALPQSFIQISIKAL